jgi:hypothetical protein|uniref:Uncharacterized protein n=1 Tax=Zea mays TaxID=4577 RepID=A0A804Q2A7_MAIZE
MSILEGTDILLVSVISGPTFYFCHASSEGNLSKMFLSQQLFSCSTLLSVKNGADLLLDFLISRARVQVFYSSFLASRTEILNLVPQPYSACVSLQSAVQISSQYLPTAMQ